MTQLFDQQPMGPVPARRPIMMPPDPELEAALDDPSTASVRLVDPIPDELVGGADQGRAPRSPLERGWRTVRWIVAVALLVPTAVGIAVAVYRLLAPGEGLAEDLRIGGGVAVAVVVFGLGAALVLSDRRGRRP